MKDFLLTPETIESNYKEFRSRINNLFPDRKDSLNILYDAIGEERLTFYPASGKKQYHNAFPGGYIDHVLRVMNFAAMNYKRYQEMGMYLDNFSREELMFAALNHDLGKLGFVGENMSGYIPQKDKWRRDNMNEVYEPNIMAPFAMVPDISIFLLQQHGVKISWNEFLGIKLHDGLYDEANKAYYISFRTISKMRTNLVQLLHEADIAAARFEFERWNAVSGELPMTKISNELPNTNVQSQTKVDFPEKLINNFNTLFN